jgi:hypothetical protein
MDDSVRKKLDRLVRQRLEATRETRERSRLMVLRNDPLAAEPSRERAAAYARHAGAERKPGSLVPGPARQGPLPSFVIETSPR